MHKLAKHFEQLLSDILPPEERLKQAKSLPAEVREFLEADDRINTVEPHTRLIGSYARSTAIASVRDMKDVDFLVFLDPSFDQEEPSSALQQLKKVLEDYPARDRVELTTQRRSIHLYLEGQDFHLDIVPSIAKNGVDQPLLVPERLQEEWIQSHPLGYGDCLTELNQENNEKVARLIRLVKHWRDVHMVIMRPKSYWLSCLVYSYIKDGQVNCSGASFAELFRDLMLAIQSDFKPILDEEEKTPEIADPMLGHNVADSWDRGHFETFMRRVDETVNWVNRALDSDAEKDEAIELWQKALGKEWFPESVEESMSARYVTPKGHILQTPRPDSASVEIPSHRFYGEED